jgi:hypothetical protein
MDDAGIGEEDIIVHDYEWNELRTNLVMVSARVEHVAGGVTHLQLSQPPCSFLDSDNLLA